MKMLSDFIDFDNHVGRASHVQECALVHHHEVQRVSLST